MLRITQNSSAAGAKSYFSSSDYYSEGQELRGTWHGKGAERLGLSGEVDQRDWDALCDNLDPRTGKTLTARQREPRRIGYDFTWDVGKSVSVLYGLTQDERILNVFQEAVGATMQEMEKEMQARVRKDGRNEDRTTGNMVWGSYIHTTARPVDGIPDPQLHCHAFVFNATWDESEERWKAGQFASLKRDAGYFEALFHARVARGLAELGLPVRRTRSGWEIDGMPASVLAKFSRRTALIEAMAAEEGVSDPRKKGELGARSRDRKRKDLSMTELQSLWRSRLDTEESEAVRSVVARIGSSSIPEDPGAGREAAERAVGHCFERRAVVPERTLLSAALKGAYGRSSVQAVLDAVAAQPLLRGVRDGQRWVTTEEVLKEEEALVAFARQGRGTCSPIAQGPHAFKRDWLNAGQKKAVSHVLGSRDRVMCIRGAAGVGKTSALQELAEAVLSAGVKVVAFAPSADASRGTLRSEGFETADTVARLLVDEKMQRESAGSLIMIDEAGLISGPQMKRVFDIAERIDARVLLVGDPRQHASVERGSVLRLLEREAGIAPAEIKEIQRQQDARYKRAVQAFSTGDVNRGFRELDALGWVREIPTAERYRVLAQDYVESTSDGGSALVVSPTHREIALVNASIREELKRRGRIAGEEREIAALASANLTVAERGDAVNLSPGDVLVYHQNAKGALKGARRVVGVDAIEPADAERYQVYRTGRIALAPGDRIRITRNGKTADGKHALNNGDMRTVRGFDQKGNLVLTNGWVVARDYEHLAYGYCTTSPASQGKSVDRVIIASSGISAPAASTEQAYVSVSRGKRSAVLYVDSKAEVLGAISKSDDRLTATEFLLEQGAHVQRLRDLERPAVSGPKRSPRKELVRE